MQSYKKRHIFSIYSHSDADGGIAASIFAKHINEKYSKYNWTTEINPVNHVSNEGDWFLKKIQWPCAILDFTLHPYLINQKFFSKKQDFLKENQLTEKQLPNCYWIDHHPTGSSFPFLTETNAPEILTHLTSKWDTKAISTPGLFRTHYEELGIPKKLIEQYEHFIDLAEIIDGAMYANSLAAHDFSSDAVKLQTLFCPNHPAIDKTALYKRLCRQIMQSPSVGELLASDPLYAAIVENEAQIFQKQLKVYTKQTKLIKNVAVANFFESKEWTGIGRFIPYLLYPEAEYAIHILPKKETVFASVSCGVNPWNKPQNQNKHIGNYFAQHFDGGGHAFVAGGRLAKDRQDKIKDLIDYLQPDLRILED